MRPFSCKRLRKRKLPRESGPRLTKSPKKIALDFAGNLLTNFLREGVHPWISPTAKILLMPNSKAESENHQVLSGFFNYAIANERLFTGFIMVNNR